MTIWLLLCTLLFGLVVIWLVVGFHAKSRTHRGGIDDCPAFSPKAELCADTSLLLSPTTAAVDAEIAAIIIDTETTGLPPEEYDQYADGDDIVAIVQVAWMLIDKDAKMIGQEGVHLLCQKADIPPDIGAIHHISTTQMQRDGEDPADVYSAFLAILSIAPLIIAHHVDFHVHVLAADMERHGIDATLIRNKPSFCTMLHGIDVTRLTDQRGRWKLPRLSELYAKLYFDRPRIDITYRDKALADIRLVRACYSRLLS